MNSQDLKTLVPIISMIREVIINFNEPALRCKPIHIYPLAVNSMELLSRLQQWHVRRFAPDVPNFIPDMIMGCKVYG